MFTTKLQFASLMFFNFREEVHVAQVKLVLLHGSLLIITVTKVAAAS